MINIAQPIITQKEIKNVQTILTSGQITQGEQVKKFEEKFAKYCGVKYAVAVNSGTAALHCALYACGIKEGNEVITTPFSFVATANSILMQNAKPVFSDIDEKTYNLDPTQIEKKITPQTKAILVVDLFGNPYDVDQINRIAKKHQLPVIEDACQAHGARFKNKKAGNLGDVGCFSFYATKNMTCGEGGMLTTNNREIAEKARMFRHHGQSEKIRYQYFDLGYNYRLTDIAATIGLVQLDKLDAFNKKRIQNARLLNQGLQNIPNLILPITSKNHSSVFHQYTIRISKKSKVNRDQFMDILFKNEIGTAIFYPEPLHLFSHLQKYGYKKGDFPIAEKVSQEIISLPVHPSLKKSEIKKIIKTIQKIQK